MLTKRKIKPGDPGSKKYLKKYGDRLVCIRYKYSAGSNKRVTTVELIEETGVVRKKEEYPANKNVLVNINFDEYELRRPVKMFGGTWNKELKLWEMKYSAAKELNITSRIKND